MIARTILAAVIGVALLILVVNAWTHFVVAKALANTTPGPGFTIQMTPFPTMGPFVMPTWYAGLPTPDANPRAIPPRGGGNGCGSGGATIQWSDGSCPPHR